MQALPSKDRSHQNEVSHEVDAGVAPGRRCSGSTVTSRCRGSARSAKPERVNRFETQVVGNQVAIASADARGVDLASNVLALTNRVCGSSGLIATTVGGRATFGRP